MNRAQRRANNKRVINNRFKQLKEVDKSYHKYLVEKRKTNKLNKQDAYDCGNPKCGCKTLKRFSTIDNKGNKRRDNNVDIKEEYLTDE